ncbi:ImmA/IrrE family metallo-endopeptidase [Bradyrhizobium sp. F1.13.3]|uniref:ImmA/IrrE family metallo-endopeptidase n=1 Tax=Bradyrhizobium sp. F1.13.3 TaxID=3156351 RepID=UPI003396507A
MSVANVEEVREDLLSPGLLEKIRAGAEKAGGLLKRALSKVMGLFHASAGLVYLDQSLIEVKKRFVRLHESAHGFLPWQRPLYAVVEDCDKSLDPDAADLFDREANVFASEVLFQLDAFRDMAESRTFEVWTPVRLAKQFNASIYASIRQYVSKNRRACAVVVLDMPGLIEGDGFRANLRRVVQSPAFTETFGHDMWNTPYYTPADEIGRLIPLGKRKSSGKRNMVLVDRNGVRHECIAESFTQRHQVFVLVHSVKTLTATLFLISA